MVYDPCQKADRNMETQWTGHPRIYSRLWKNLFQYMRLVQLKTICMAWGLITALGFGSLLGGWSQILWLRVVLLRVTRLGFCSKQCLINELFHFHPGILGSTYRRALLMLMQTAHTMLEKSLWILVVLIGQVWWRNMELPISAES